MSTWEQLPYAHTDTMPLSTQPGASPLASLDPTDEPIRSESDLLSPFVSAFKPRTEWRVGTEAEKFGLRPGTPPQPVAFDGEGGVQKVLCSLAERFGWQPQREHAEGEIISLTRGQASITLEPAAQLELSGAPFATIHETSAEYHNHIEELRAVSEPVGITWLSMGFHPFASHAELPHVPKLRYAIMRRYMPTRGARSVDMMGRTCTVQANLDFSDEADAMRKLRVGLALQPIATAMFANSPFFEGKRGQYLTERGAVWLEMDRDRSGLLPFALKPNAPLEAYVQWALDVPMFMVKRGSKVLENTGQTFRSFMESGFEGAVATQGDWQTHLNSLFPEARLKRTLELRGADALPTPLVCAVPALWKGLLYDPTALDRAEAMIEPLTFEALQAARPEIVRRGLAASLVGRPVQEWAEAVLELALGGLQRLASPGLSGETDETRYLTPMVSMVGRGETPAIAMLAALSPDEPLAATILRVGQI